jgi:hypothetical protein
MKTLRLGRIAAIAALSLVALVLIGYAAGGGNTGSSNDVAPMAVEEPGSFDAEYDVQSTIDRALGRESTVLPQPVDPKGVPPAAASQSLVDEQSRRIAGEGAAGGVTSNNGGAGANATSLVDDRKIVQTASLRLQVEEVGGSFEEVSRIAAGAGGFVASSNFSLQGEDQVAAVTIRVPAGSYQEVLSELRALGVKVDAESSKASDVTEEYSDLSARLRNLEATETQLLSLLGQADTISEILQVQDRLNGVRGEIEQVKGRMALLDKLTDLATITVHLRPVVGGSQSPEGPNNLGNAIDEAWDESIEFLGSIAAGAVTVVVFAWWLPVVGVPAYVIGSRVLRSRPRPVEGA